MNTSLRSFPSTILLARGICQNPISLALQLHALNATTGLRKFVSPTIGAIYGSPLVTASAVVVGSFGGNWVYSLDLVSGGLQWAFSGAGGSLYSSPVLSTSGLTVMIGSDDNLLYALNAATGALQWTFATNGTVRAVNE